MVLRALMRCVRYLRAHAADAEEWSCADDACMPSCVEDLRVASEALSLEAVAAPGSLVQALDQVLVSPCASPCRSSAAEEVRAAFAEGAHRRRLTEEERRQRRRTLRRERAAHRATIAGLIEELIQGHEPLPPCTLGSAGGGSAEGARRASARAQEGTGEQGHNTDPASEMAGAQSQCPPSCTASGSLGSWEPHSHMLKLASVPEHSSPRPAVGSQTGGAQGITATAKHQPAALSSRFGPSFRFAVNTSTTAQEFCAEPGDTDSFQAIVLVAQRSGLPARDQHPPAAAPAGGGPEVPLCSSKDEGEVPSCSSAMIATCDSETVLLDGLGSAPVDFSLGTQPTTSGGLLSKQCSAVPMWGKVLLRGLGGSSHPKRPASSQGLETAVDVQPLHLRGVVKTVGSEWRSTNENHVFNIVFNHHHQQHHAMRVTL